ncbi:Sensor histidine kinase ResE [bioreactor metagenome]|uniref:histidine kinase n=1 Tax=bioreactor metagenome TaxID=1076179 RepID=A0A645F990_9ZZZZ
MARFETGEAKPQRTKVDLLSIIGTVLIGFEQRIKEKNIYTEVHFAANDIYVNADYDMIFQVVYNLIENAVKFVNENGVIGVHVEIQQKKAVCFIKNTGQGIPVEDINMIYERFYKTDKSRGVDKTGVGLGLHIVKSIILSHEETINVNSIKGEYTEFSFTLPLWDKNS